MSAPSPEFQIVNWTFKRPGDFWDLMRNMKNWMEPNGRVWEDEDGNVRLATGGCGENEELMFHLRQNIIMWGLCWVSSHRGGLTILKPPLAAKGERHLEPLATKPSETEGLRELVKDVASNIRTHEEALAALRRDRKRLLDRLAELGTPMLPFKEEGTP